MKPGGPDARPTSLGDGPALMTPRVMPALPPRIFSDAEWERIRAGCSSGRSGAKWTARCRGDVLRLHRSETGYGIYEATFVPTADGGRRIARALVEGHARRYRSPSTEYDALVLELVVSAVLLDEPAHGLRAALTRLMRAASGVADMPSEVVEHSILGDLSARPYAPTGAVGRGAHRPPRPAPFPESE